MTLSSMYYTQLSSDLYTQNQRYLDESKATYILYNGALDEDEDPADYITPLKAVRLA